VKTSRNVFNENVSEKKVLYSSAKKMNVKIDKGGFKEGWLWQLPFEISSEDSRYSMVIFGNLRSLFNEEG